MASLPTQSFDQIVINAIAGIQGRNKKLINFSTGSGLRSIVEGFAGVFLWFQGLVLQLLTAIRLSTSSGIDVDTFTADFMPIIPGSQSAILPNGSPRLGAQASSGQEMLSRFTAGTNSIFIPVGSTINTNDGNNTKFAVVANPTYPTYSVTPAPGGYTLAPDVASIVVPIQCTVAGAIGNVQPGSISVMTSNITGIDVATNVAAFANGADQESDSALKQRFSAFILGLSRGDIYGLTASILGSEVNIQWTLAENYNYNGSFHPGFFFVVADDGSGSPTPAFLAIVMQAILAVRPLGVQFALFAPVVIQANVSMQLTTSPGYQHNVVVAQVEAAIVFNINALGLGNELPFSLLAAWAYAIPGVAVVSAVLLNGQTGDNATILPSFLSTDGKYTIYNSTIKPGVITVS